MRNNRWVWVGVYVAATAVLVAGVAVLVKDRDRSEAATSDPALAELAPMPFASAITPAGTTSGRVGDSLPFVVEGFTDRELASVELWDGDRRIETVAVAGASSAVVTLPALSVGPHAVYAAVVDDQGKRSLTAPTPVEITANGTEPVAPVEVAADEGETVEQLAKRLHIDVDRIAVTAGAQGDIPPDKVKPLGLGPSDVIPVDAIASAQPDGDARLDGAISVEAQLPDGGGSAGTSKGTLAIAASVDGCAVTITASGVSGSTGTVDVFDGAGSTVGWVRVGQRHGDGSITLPAVSPGVHLYFAAAGADQTSPIPVTMPASCTKAVGWTGDVSITDGVLTVDRSVPAGRQWLYLQVDGGTAIRVPATGNLPSVGLHTDIGALLPPLEGASMTVELWQGDEFTDHLIAKGALEAPAGGSISDIVGESRLLHLKLTDPSGPGAADLGTQDRKLTFTWTAGPRIEAVLYQVLVADHPITQTKLTPQDLIASGVGVRSGAGSAGTGTFTIDTADIPGRAATGRDAASVTAAYPAPTPQVIGTKVTSGTTPATVTPIGPDAAQRAAEAPILIDLPTYGDDVYVRAVGIASGGSGVLTASNTVRIGLPVPQGVDGTSVDFVSGTDFGDTTWKPGHLPVRSFQDCVWANVAWNGPIDYGKYVDHSPHAQSARIEAMSAAYPTDGTYCPRDFPPPPAPADAGCPVAQFFCDVWAGVVEFASAVLSAADAVYTFVTTAMSTVVDQIAKAVAKYSGVCDALEGVASGSKKTCGAVLEMATQAAISAVLASVGVPPVLPDPGLLAAVAKGDFATVAVALMEATGIPCSTLKPDPDVSDAMDEVASHTTGAGGLVTAAQDPCRAMATALVATVKSQVLAKAQTAIAQAVGLPYQPITHPSYPFTLSPSPLGRTGVTPVTLRMQPRDDNADASDLACAVTVRVVNLLDEGGQRTVVPGQTVVVPELAAPNRGRWEKQLVLTSTAPTKDLLYGTWRLQVTPIVGSPCRLAAIDLPGEPAALPNYAKDRKKGQPTVAAANPNS